MVAVDVQSDEACYPTELKSSIIGLSVRTTRSSLTVYIVLGGFGSDLQRRQRVHESQTARPLKACQLGSATDHDISMG